MDPRPSDVYLSMQLMMGRISGVWPCTEDTVNWKKLICRMIYYFTLGIKIITLTAVLCQVSIDWGHLPDPVGTITILTSHINSIFSMIYIPAKINKLQELIMHIDNIFIVPNKHSKQIFHNIYNKYMKLATVTGKGYIASGFICGSFLIIMPLLSEKTDGKQPLPYAAALPFDVSCGINYWFAYFLLGISYMSMAVNGTINCELFISIIIKTTCQFRFLQQKILNIRDDFNTLHDKSTKKKSLSSGRALTGNGNIGKDKVEDKIVNEVMIQRLNECIQYHQVLLEFANNFNIQANPFMFAEMLAIFFFICSNVFTLSTVSIISSIFLQRLVFILCIIAVLFLFSWFGNELKLQSMEVAEAAYNCDWVDAPQPFKTSLGIIMMRAQKSVQITTWKFGNVDLDMFLMVMKSSYSFYQVLHEVYG